LIALISNAHLIARGPSRDRSHSAGRHCCQKDQKSFEIVPSSLRGRRARPIRQPSLHTRALLLELHTMAPRALRDDLSQSRHISSSRCQKYRRA
jgi:hypothetical protein